MKHVHVRLHVAAGAALIVIAATLSILAQPAFAAFGVYPSRIEVMTQRGATESFEVSATTMGMQNPLRLQIAAWDFARDENGGLRRIAKADAERFYGASEWLETPTGTIELKPDREQALKFNLKVPKNTRLGTHYCYLTFKTSPVLDEPPATSGKSMRAPIGYSINALLLVSVEETGGAAPTLRRSANLSKFAIKVVNTGKTVPINTVIRNSGNSHLVIGEDSTVRISRGSTEAVKLPLDSYTLLPESSIAIPLAWKPDRTIAMYKAVLSADVGLGDALTAERTFLVISLPLLFAIVAGVIVLVAALILFSKRYRIQLAPREKSGP